jgi:hypothetical protein
MQIPNRPNKATNRGPGHTTCLVAARKRVRSLKREVVEGPLGKERDVDKGRVERVGDTVDGTEHAGIATDDGPIAQGYRAPVIARSACGVRDNRGTCGLR